MGPLSRNEVVADWGDTLNPDAFGQVTVLVGHGSTLVDFIINSDPPVPWNMCGADTPANQVDLWSTVSHEIGHMINLGDLLGFDGSCKNDATRAEDSSLKPSLTRTEFREGGRVVEAYDVVDNGRGWIVQAMARSAACERPAG